MKVEPSLRCVKLGTNIRCDKLENISALKIFLNASAGYIWPAGRYLTTPVLGDSLINLLSLIK